MDVWADLKRPTLLMDDRLFIDCLADKWVVV